ncbi:MAG: hypothetical protein ACTSPB_23615 [Candidatus Thorarchaeota archaeon]
MGETEIINELKRLSDVITQLQNSNNNLSNVIAELQTSNTTLSNQLTEIQTTNSKLNDNISQLTDVNTKLVEVNIRALDDTDKAHVPLAYDLNSFNKNNSSTWSNNATATDLSATDSDWGSGLDFYPVFFLFYLKNTSQYMTKLHQGFEIQLIELTAEPTSITFFRKSYNFNNAPVVALSSGAEYYVMLTEQIYGNKINSDSTLYIYFTNLTGVDIPAGYAEFFFTGFTK